jgi:Zn-dependent protease/predicted transcriptional regulator
MSPGGIEMKWSWRVGQVAGIGIYIHATMLLLLAFLGYIRLQGGAGVAGALLSIGAILALFACVLLHELGHALTAKRFGIGTRDITLLPIGGVARLERMPREPKQELMIAIAGPAVNVVIALVLILIHLALGKSFTLNPWAMVERRDLLQSLLSVNISLVLFNLLPAFPMDGGRVLRALLAQQMPYARATAVAASVGQGMAFLFGLWGLLGGGVILLFIALFVYIGAGEEAAAVQITEMFRGVPVRQAMITRFSTLSPSDPLSRAVECLLAGAQQDFPVMETSPLGETRLVGLLTRADLMPALSERGPKALIADVMNPVVEVARPNERLETIFQSMQTHGLPSLPVMEDGRLVGLINLENIGEFLMVRSALQGFGGEGPSPGSVGEQVAGRSATGAPL